ncbi:MAG: tetratricopeptide repeat protein [Candidatus Poseidoniaceae archaeon]|nr:tetratricopeptide repeat protein [Candidatus Poseidoniaceae archaeon]
MGWWLSKTHESLDELGDGMILLQEAQASTSAVFSMRLDGIESNIQHLVAGLDGVRAAHPELDGTILAHEALKGKGEALEALENLIASIPLDADHETTPLLQPGPTKLAVSLIETIDHIEGFTAPDYRRIALVALESGRMSRARDLLFQAYDLIPGDDVTLRILEQTAILAGDSFERRKWLEERLKISPDSPELLRAHAHLLATMGDETAEVNIKRLEALGLDTAADRSLLSGLRDRAGARSEALEAIESALEEDPTRSDDWCRRGEILMALEEKGKALESVDRCLELDRQNGTAWAIRAQVLSESHGRSSEALKAAIHAVALDAGGTDLIMLKSDLLEAAGEGLKSDEAIEKSLAKHTNDGHLRAAIASRRLLQGRHTEAWDVLHGTPEGVNHPDLWVIEGRLHLANADRHRDGTGTTDRKLLADASLAFENALAMDRESGIAWLGLARVQRLLGEIGKADETLTRARRLLPDEDPSAAAESALLYLERDDIESATQAIDAASIRGEGAVVSYVRGNIAARQGHLKRALSHFDEAIETEPTHVRARLNRASIHMALENGQAALEDSEVMLELAPSLALARLRRAEANMLLSNWKLAKDDLKLIIDDAPHHHHALTQIAACYISMGRPEKAEAPLNEALRLSPDHTDAWHQRGLLYLDWGREEAALADFEAAVRCDGEHIDARLHIAAIHHESERFVEASAAWRGVLAIDPDNPVARRRNQECEMSLATI